MHLNANRLLRILTQTEVKAIMAAGELLEAKMGCQVYSALIIPSTQDHKKIFAVSYALRMDEEART